MLTNKAIQMKLFKNCLVLLAIVLSSAGVRSPEILHHGTSPNNKRLAARVVLDYSGSVTGPQSMGIGIQVTIDTLVGVRYEVTLNGAISSHVALFYKFAKPHQTIFYNFKTHKSTVNKESSSPDSDPNVDVVGKETVGAYACTHLQHGAGSREITDYWMSSQIPGFLELIHSLKTISADLP
jgi:hypothetical protein